MKVGTKSVLYGAHCFFIHPWFVAAAWTGLYGFPRDPRLWIAFFIHDLGLWGKPNFDGPEGEQHPWWAAKIMGRWFGPEWGDFCLFHSRYMARRLDAQPSRLCYADKLSITLEPWWLYLPRVHLTGEIVEYLAQAPVWTSREPVTDWERREATSGSSRRWFNALCKYMQRWVSLHAHGQQADTWTMLRNHDVESDD